MNVSVIPSGWTSDSLGNLVNIAIGKTPKRDEPKYWHGGRHKWATIANMKFGEELNDTTEYITDLALRETNIKKVAKGTLLFSFKLTIGKMAFAGCDLYTNEAIAALTPKNARIDKKFLFYALQVANLTGNAGDAAKGKTLNTKTLPLIEVAFPEDIKEQRRIVARIEELTRRAEEARKLAADRETELDALLQALYSRMIEGVEWKTLVSIRSVVEEKETWNSRQDPRGQVEYLEISGIDNSLGRVVKTKTIPTSNPPSRAKKLIRVGDIVFGTTRPYLKNIAVIPENLDNQVCSTGFCVLRPQTDKVLTEWLFAICRSDLVVEQVTPGQEKHAYPAVSDDAVLDSFIPLPDVSEQRRIVARIEKLTRRVEKVRKLIAEAESQILQFQSALLAKAFRGEL